MPACHAGDRRFESGRVRHRAHPSRPVRPPGRGVFLPGSRSGSSSVRPSTAWHPSAVKRLPVVAAVAVLAVALASGVVWNASRGRPDASSGVAVAPSQPSSASAGSPTVSQQPTWGPSPLAPGPASEPPVATMLADVPIVPVAQFRTTVEGIGGDDVRAALAGTSPRWQSLELVENEADAILAGLGVDRPAGDDGLVLTPDAASLMRDLAKNRKRLGVLRADAVGPSVRALGWGGRFLFGVGAVKTTAAWSLTARLPQRIDTPVFDPGASWTLVAGGDIMLDRGVAQTLKIRGKGADFPFDGGTADITGRTCCSAFGWKVPILARTGHAGAMRHLVQSADIAIANFENPAPDA